MAFENAFYRYAFIDLHEIQWKLSHIEFLKHFIGFPLNKHLVNFSNLTKCSKINDFLTAFLTFDIKL